jgi:hypothetical protein
MSKNQEELKASIKAKTDRELQETIAYFSNENEKHLRGINNTLNWFFWIFIFSFLLWIISAVISKRTISIHASY